QVLMAARVALDTADLLEAKPAIKVRGLKIVGLQGDLRATARARLALGRAHQARAVAVVAQRRGDKEIADVAGGSPGPGEQAADRSPGFIAQEGRDEGAIADARARHIKVVDLLLEDANVLGPGLVF